MEIDSKQLKNKINNYSVALIGDVLFKEDGSLNRDVALKMFQGTAKGQNEVQEIKNVEQIEIKGVDGKTEGIELTYDEFSKTIDIYVPEWMQKQVRFDIDYIFGRFDRIEQSVAELADEFFADRIAPITYAETKLSSMERDPAKHKLFSEQYNRLGTICDNVGTHMDALQHAVVKVVNRVNSIPSDRKFRLFKVPVKKVLKDVDIAKAEILYLLRGTGVYAELSMKLGSKGEALQRIDDTIAFLSELREHGDRLDQWYDDKDQDDFWQSGLTKRIDELKTQRNALDVYDGKIIIEAR